MALLTDYRLMVYLMIFFPLWDQVNGSKRAYWWPKMYCLTGAFHDLRCADFSTTAIDSPPLLFPRGEGAGG